MGNFYRSLTCQVKRGHTALVKKFWRIFFILVFFGSKNLFARFQFHQGFLYFNHANTEESFTFNHLTSVSFLAATLGKNDSFLLGQSVIYWNHTHQDSAGQSKIGILELGPRFAFYFNEANNFLISAAFHPYAKGTRVDTVNKQLQQVSGWSYFLSFAAQAKVTKHFYLGASLNYHGLSINSVTVGAATSTTSSSYTTIFPLLEMSFRFK